MTFWSLIRRSLRFHARSHLGVLLGAAIGSATLTGALIVGDSVRQSLTEMALRRLGPIHFALGAQDRLFRVSLGPRLREVYPPDRIQDGSSSNITVYPFSAASQSSALMLPGMVARQDGTARANRVNVIGVVYGLWPRLAQWRMLSPELWVTTPEGRNNPGALVSDEEAQRRRRLTEEWRSGQTAFLNETLARQLGARVGDEILLRVRKPSRLGLDAAISPRNENSVALRLKVGAILTPEMLGDFALTAQATPPANLFLPLGFLSEKLGVPDQANLMVTGPILVQPKPGLWDGLRLKLAQWLWKLAPLTPLYGSNSGSPFFRSDDSSLAARLASRLEPKSQIQASDNLALPWLNTELGRAWIPEDAGFSVHAVEPPLSIIVDEQLRPFVELTSSRIFLEPAVAAAALRPRTNALMYHVGLADDRPGDIEFCQFVTNGVPVLTYLANLIRAGDRATPYSMVTAAGGEFVPPDMRNDEILVNQWLAEDLNVKPGDSVALSYYVVDSGSHLVERTNTFRVRQIVPLAGIYADRTLMPDFPGLAKAESTHDWDAGFPLVYPIREKDEAYWKAYRGTPKAFVTLAAGQAMWANRYGALTAIRYTVPTNSFASTYRNAAERNLPANLTPAEVGLRFEPVRAQALQGAAQAQDFGQLFLGFSLFLVVAALLLMALLFQFGLEQRVTEVGTLLAIGFRPVQVRRLFLREGAVVALGGGLVGALGGVAYAQAMLWGLTTLWRSAVGPSVLRFHATLTTLIIGACAATVIAWLTMWVTLRKQARRPARELLSGTTQDLRSAGHSRGRWIATVAGIGAAAIVGWALAKGETANAEAFFGAGVLVLIAGLAASAAWFARLTGESAAQRITLRSLGVRGCVRRRTRSLSTVALLACGSFLIVAIGVFRLDAERAAAERSSGTGGYALLGESTLPVVQDLNTKAGREFFALSPDGLAGVSVVPLRVRAGDEASCLNLSRAQKPRLLGVKPEQLKDRFTFTGVAKGLDRSKGWELLRGQRNKSQIPNPKSQGSKADTQASRNHTTSAGAESEEIPAIGDANSLEWALGKKLGDTLDYVDEQGRPFKLRLVGAVANSILQGSLLIDEAAFVKRFPGESGYRSLLIDAPTNTVAQVSATLSHALQDTGLEVTPAAQRLNEFNAVQNTYLGTFQVLGGLGLLLGSAGLGVVVLRNVLERRGELGLLVAVGFRRSSLQRLVLIEHGALLGLGLGIGVLAAAIAVLPALLSPGSHLPVASLSATLGAVLLNGVIWTTLTAWYALRGNLLDALRNE